MKGNQRNYVNENSLSKEQVKTTNQWMDFKQKKPGATKLNVKYLREYKEIRDDFSKLIILTYWLMTELDIKYAGSMFHSAKAQKEEIKEMERYRKAYREEQRKIDRSYEHLYR